MIPAIPAPLLWKLRIKIQLTCRRLRHLGAVRCNGCSSHEMAGLLRVRSLGEEVHCTHDDFRQDYHTVSSCPHVTSNKAREWTSQARQGTVGGLGNQVTRAALILQLARFRHLRFTGWSPTTLPQTIHSLAAVQPCGPRYIVTLWKQNLGMLFKLFKSNI